MNPEKAKLKKTGVYGVTQESVLGSLLYIISQNDLPDAPSEFESGQTTLYVDDDTEQELAATRVELEQKLQVRVDSVTNWLIDNRMIVEPTKSKLIVSITKELRSRRWENIDLTIRLIDHIIKPTSSEKLLGIIISEDMPWNLYIWGEKWRDKGNRTGVIPQLIQRLSMLKYIARFHKYPS